VTVADHATPPIDKACGEGLMPDSHRYLEELGIRLQDVETGAFQGIKFLRGDREASARFPYGVGYGVRRTVMHELMVRRATDAGVNLHWGARVDTSRSDDLFVNGKAVRARWIVAADGINSTVRKWAGLDTGYERERRIGYRMHFRVHQWSDFVEIYWGRGIQAYITPISPTEICVALISKRKLRSFAEGLMSFPRLQERLAEAICTSSARGSLTISRRFRSVFRGHVALIGEASGSVDAITGEGLAMAFRQSLALADAIAAGDLSQYGSAHHAISEVPGFTARAMLLMDKSNWLQHRAVTAFMRRPELFARMLSVHVGAARLTKFGRHGTVNLALELLSA
jgi:flavin-dependent dehydrogenase